MGSRADGSEKSKQGEWVGPGGKQGPTGEEK